MAVELGKAPTECMGTRVGFWFTELPAFSRA